MIEYNSKVWFRHIINFRKVDTFRALLPEMSIVGIYTALMALVHETYLEQLAESQTYKNSMIVHSSLGFILSLLLVFRTNSAYDRWWEGRKLWGALVNSSRNLAIKINTLVPRSNQATREFFRVMIPNFAFTLKGHLRNDVRMDDLEDLEGIKERLEEKDHKPNHLIQEMYRQAKQLVDEKQISPEEQLIIDKELKSFADILGGCERILKTPIPFSYNIFLKKFIFFYILTLPLGFIAYFSYWAVPVSMFVFYVLVSLEIIAEEIEDPFGTDLNDLPTETISSNIRGNVVEIFES